MGPSEAGVGHSMGALEAPGGERLAHAARCARLMGVSWHQAVARCVRAGKVSEEVCHLPMTHYSGGRRSSPSVGRGCQTRVEGRNRNALGSVWEGR